MNVKAAIYISLFICINSCINIKTETTSAEEHIEIDEQQALQLEGLETYMLSTHFTGHIANIQTTKQIYDTHSDDDLIEVIHTVNADVLETFIGSTIDNIEFKMITEADESIDFDKEIIISLCESNNEFFWAGAGSIFPANSLFIKKAMKIKNTQSTDILPSFCE